ncbi:concanavalin A-like lectin/glucanase domain-containing protein [Chytridium lagenaria]|nr:concanavalin A-like lectin/glucanase domain-containing protein [Chytridium lagenaria]
MHAVSGVVVKASAFFILGWTLQQPQQQQTTTTSSPPSSTSSSNRLSSWLFIGDQCSLVYPNFSRPLTTSDLALEYGKIDFIPDEGAMMMTLLPPSGPIPSDARMESIAGQQSRLSTARSLLYGSVEAKIRAAPGGGVITALTLINDATKDEIDWEWVGSDTGGAWTNFFWKGLRQRDPNTTFELWATRPAVVDPTRNFYTYKMDWTPYEMTWYVEGQLVHRQRKNETWQLAGVGRGYNASLAPDYDHYHYPDSPMKLKIGVWNLQEKPWADGPVNWRDPSTASGFQGFITSLNITCYNGPYPSAPNAPPTDPRSSDRNGAFPNVDSFAPVTTKAVTTATPKAGPGLSTAPISFPSEGGKNRGWRTVVVGIVLAGVAFFHLSFVLLFRN